ncbi:MAG TPA: hypothetical protein VIY48_13650 [Candidatus Paceibacterota bacterium]
MSKEMTVIVLGLWIAIVPYLGIPGTWRTVILLLSGLGIAIVGFLLRGEALGRGQHRNARTTFVEAIGEPTTPAQIHEQESIGSLN